MQICLTKPARSALLVLAVLAALALAACGGDDGGDSGDLGGDPATLAPADSLVYAGATLRPEGTQKDGLLAALGKLLGEDDPGAKIREQVEEAAADEGYSYAEDFEPWLGSRAAFFLTAVGEDDGDGAGVVAVTDRDAAEETVQRLIDEGGEPTEAASYGGSDYTLVGEGEKPGAVGFVGDFLVAGTESGLQAAVDANSGEALSDDADASAALAALPDGTLLEAYVDGGGLIDALVDSGVISEKDLEAAGGGQIEQLREAPIVVGAGADAESFFIEGSAAAGDQSEAATVAGLPDEAWLALAVPMVGEAISQSYTNFLQGFEQGFRDSFGGPAGLEGIPDPSAGFAPPIPDLRGEIEDVTGLDLSRDLDWAGTLSLFAQGTSIFNLGGGLVIDSDDDEAAAATVEKLRKALERGGSVQVTKTNEGFTIAIPGAPVPAEVAVRDGKVVLAVAGVSVDAIIDPSSTLADNEAFGAASSELGDDLDASFFLDMPTIVQLIESTGQVDDDPSYQSARPYLQAIRFLVLGSGVDGDRSLGRLVLGVQDAPASSSSPAEAAALVP